MKADVLKRLVEICGSRYVLRSREALEFYSRCTIPWSRSCGAVVFPANVDQVCAVVRLCNEFTIPIWPFSRGHNWGFGTVLALQEGALIMILERMNRIHEVNEELCYAVIEPGVSQRQLLEYLQSSGSNLWIDCTDSTPDGSLIGNALDKGVGYTPYGDHFGHLCGMETVLPDGRVVASGGVSESCPTRYTYKWGTGPFIDGLFAQSSLGIVTKAGLWLMPKPESFEMFVIVIPNPGTLPLAIDALRELGLRGIVNHCHGFNEFLALARSFGYPDLLKGQSFLSEKDIERLAREHWVPSWTFVGGLYGTRRHVKASEAEIARHFSSLGEIVFIDDSAEKSLNSLVRGVRKPGVRGILHRCLKFLLDLYYPKTSNKMMESLLKLYPILKGQPNESILSLAYFKNKERQPEHGLDPVRDECGFIWFSPVLPASGTEITQFIAQVKQICAHNQFETGIVLIQRNPRTCLMLVPLFFQRQNSEEAERAQRTYDQLCNLLETKDYQHHRCCTPQMEKVLKGNPEYQNLLRQIKKALDPNRIIAPGRYGI